MFQECHRPPSVNSFVGDEVLPQHPQGTAQQLDDMNVRSTIHRSSLSRLQSRRLAEQQPHVVALTPTPPRERSEDGSYHFSDITTPTSLNKDNVSLGMEPCNNSKVPVKDHIPLTTMGNMNYPRKRILCRPEGKKTTDTNILGNSSTNVYEESIEDQDIVSAKNDEAEASGEVASNARTKDEKHDEHKDTPATDKDAFATITDTDNKNLEGKHVDKRRTYA